MELFFSIGNIIVAIIALLIGFKVYNPFRNADEPEKEKIWYDKFGTLFKVVGFVILIIGILRFFIL